MAQVDVLIWDSMLPHLPDVLRLLMASEVAQAPEGDLVTRVTLDMPYAPDGAVVVEPNLQRTPNGVRVRSLVWSFPDDASERPPGDESDSPVQCWHCEPNSPCDWDVCRQPERLSAGDCGTDPAA